MAKTKKKQDDETPELKEFEITSAQIKDDFCNYSFEILKGTGLGDTHNVKGKGIVDTDMHKAFARLNVHLAFVDDIFKHSNREVSDIDTLHGDELTTLYAVTGFKIKGGKDNESIVLSGSKYVGSVAGRIEMESPKIPLDNLSSYQWHNELKAAADQAREEVALYKGGKCTPVEFEEKGDSNQLTIAASLEEEEFLNN